MKLSRYRFLIPNFFTSLSLFLGMAAIQFIFDGSFKSASMIIFLAMLCDFLDGKFARLLNAQSKFGALFDTLSDFFTFGVVPGFLAYKFALYHFNFGGVAVSFIYVFAGGYRLVRFTLEHSESKIKKPFSGLPIPAAAGLISSFIIFNIYLEDNIFYHVLLLLITLFSSLLMISRIEYVSLDKNSKSKTVYKSFFLVFVVSLIMIFYYPYTIILIWMTAYVFYGIIHHLFYSLKK